MSSIGGTFGSLLDLKYTLSGLRAGEASVEVMRSGVRAEADLDFSEFFRDC